MSLGAFSVSVGETAEGSQSSDNRPLTDGDVKYAKRLGTPHSCVPPTTPVDGGSMTEEASLLVNRNPC